MTTPHRPSSVERFLGPAAAGAGPFAILGLSPDSLTDEQVLAALERQLQRIEAHPEGDTPAADEVRLALHAAAAQLLDAAVRQQLIFRWRDGTPTSPLGTGTGSAADLQGLENDARLTLAHYGGWNKESLRRLALLASARGLPSTAVADVLLRLNKAGASAPAAPATPPPRPAPAPRPGLAPAASHSAAAPPPQPAPIVEPRRPDSPADSKNREMLIIAGALAVMALAFLILLGIIIITTSRPVAPQQQQAAATTPPPVQPTPAPAPSSPSAAAPQPAAPAAPAPSRAAQRFNDVHEAIRALRAAAEDARSKPGEASIVFADAVEWLGGWWCRLEIDQLRAANDAVVEFIYAVSPWPDEAASAVDVLAAGAAPLASAAGGAGIAAQDVWPAVWSTGMLVRLTRERDLPADLTSRIDRALRQTLGADRPRANATFNTGAAAALARMPLRLIGVPPPPTVTRPGPAIGQAAPDSVEPALRRWAEAIAVTLDDPLAQERLLIDGLEQIMADAAEPDADRRVFEAIAFLATEIRWRRGGPARARLVDWFRDARISSGDLNVLTNAMATGSAAEGVNPTMVLPWTAAEHEREKLRADYAAAWGIAEAAGRDEAAQAWADAVAAALNRTRPSTSPMTEIAQAAELALLHQAARHLWLGDSARAESAIQQAASIYERSTASVDAASRTSSVLRPGEATDGQWAYAYLAVGQNRQLRLERLAELEYSGYIGGPADAETLVEAACFASPAEVRAAAQRVVTRMARNPLIVNAMLESLPKAPKIESVSVMIEVVAGVKLPNPSDPEWTLAARRALVERLAELLAGGIPGYGAFDRAAATLRGAYGAATIPGGGPDLGGPATELADLWRSWRAEAETFTPNPHAPMPLEKIISRRAGRAALALGPVQAWAAEQVSLAEILAYIVCGESPSRAPHVRQIMDDLANQRRAAAHVFEQIRVTERAMLRLWLLRLGKESAWTGA